MDATHVHSLLLQVDLLPSEQAVVTVESAIQQHNSTVNILRTTRCTMDIAQILDQGAFVGSSQPPTLQAVGEVLNADVADQRHQPPASENEQPAHSDKGGSLTASGGSSSKEDAVRKHTGDAAALQKQNSHHGHTHHSHHHDSSVRSVSITHPGQVDMAR